MAAVGTCVEQPTERQGTIQSASTTHTRQHPHHARRNRYHLEARLTAVRKNAQSHLTRCGTGATRAETAPTPHTTDAGELALIHLCIRAKKPSRPSALPRGNQHTLDFFFDQVTDPKFHNETRSTKCFSIQRCPAPRRHDGSAARHRRSRRWCKPSDRSGCSSMTSR